jgi:hypothetical protein
VKVFRLFRLERIFFVVQSVDVVGRWMYNILSIGRASMFVMPCWLCIPRRDYALV